MSLPNASLKLPLVAPKRRIDCNSFLVPAIAIGSVTAPYPPIRSWNVSPMFPVTVRSCPTASPHLLLSLLSLLSLLLKRVSAWSDGP